MTTYQVTYYVKPLTATRIYKLGGPWGEKTEQTVINEIRQNLSQYRVSGSGHSADIEIEYSGLGAPYLKTVADGIRVDNLSYLPRHYA